MSESCAIELYENECFDRRKGGWTPHKEFPFVIKATLTPCKPLDEIELPGDEWQWATNWKISKMPGVTDADGWEYASRFSRFKRQDRAPKSEAVWSRARRRLWIRIMRRETTVKASDISKVLPKIQLGLSSVHSARIKIEEIMKHAPEAADSDQMRSLVTSVNRNIADIISVLDQAEKTFNQDTDSSLSMNSRAAPKQSNSVTNNSPAILKKLRNDVTKEQLAIERALEGKSNAIPIAPSNGSTKVGSVASSSSFVGSVSSASLKIASHQSQKFTGNPLKTDPVPSASHRSNSVELRQDLSGVNQIVSSKKTAVKSGSAGAFNPSIFVNQNQGIGANGPEDGVFVDRTTHDLLIEQVGPI